MVCSPKQSRAIHLSGCPFDSNLMNRRVDPNDAKANFSSGIGGSFLDGIGRFLLGPTGDGG